MKAHQHSDLDPMFLGSPLHGQAMATLVAAFLLRLYFLMCDVMSCEFAAEGPNIIERDGQP
jgi:hypothetical protein